eukprot:scaffold1970_cov396-Prasinococcus_capsulatus_cf.AAC.33
MLVARSCTLLVLQEEKQRRDDVQDYHVADDEAPERANAMLRLSVSACHTCGRRHAHSVLLQMWGL